MGASKASRDSVFAELRTLVDEFDSTDSSWSLDDTLGHMLIRLNAEIRRSRKEAEVGVP